MRAALAAAALALLCAAPAAAAPTLVELGRFASPVHVAVPPGDSQVFVVEQDGLVRLAGSGATFLDVTDRTDGGGERGLLSMAFAPDYEASGLFYVFLPTTGSNSSLQVIDFRRSAADRLAPPAEGR